MKHVFFLIAGLTILKCAIFANHVEAMDENLSNCVKAYLEKTQEILEKFQQEAELKGSAENVNSDSEYDFIIQNMPLYDDVKEICEISLLKMKMDFESFVKCTSVIPDFSDTSASCRLIRNAVKKEINEKLGFDAFSDEIDDEEGLNDQISLMEMRSQIKQRLRSSNDLEMDSKVSFLCKPKGYGGACYPGCSCKTGYSCHTNFKCYTRPRKIGQPCWGTGSMGCASGLNCVKLFDLRDPVCVKAS